MSDEMTMHRCIWCERHIDQAKQIHTDCLNKISSPTFVGGSLEDWVRLSSMAESLPVELSEVWQKWTSHPVISHNMAPREARAALEIIGQLADRGYRISKILDLIVQITGPGLRTRLRPY